MDTKFRQTAGGSNHGRQADKHALFDDNGEVVEMARAAIARAKDNTG